MSNSRAGSAGEAIHVAANGALVALFLFPLLWMIAGAFKSEGDLLSPDPVWLFAPVLDHWRFIFENWAVEHHLVNSAIISIATTVATLALGFPAAYGLSRFPLWRKDAILFDILSLKMIPPIASAVPLFILAKQVGLYNTHLVLILLNTAFQLPFALLVLKSFIDEIPREIDEAARIDGCSAARRHVARRPAAGRFPGSSAARCSSSSSPGTSSCWPMSWSAALSGRCRRSSASPSPIAASCGARRWRWASW